jgi:hypothetical protein
VQLQFKYQDFLSDEVVLTHEHVEFVHIGGFGYPSFPPGPSSVMLSIIFSTQQLYVVPFFVHELLPKLRFLKVEVLYVQEQFKYHDFLSEEVVFTHEHVELVHIGYFGPGLVMLSIMFSTQQLYVVPFFVHELVEMFKLLNVAFLYVQLQFQYHDFLSDVVVFTHEQVVFVHYGYPPWVWLLLLLLLLLVLVLNIVILTQQ